jgi:hypothetical protein
VGNKKGAKNDGVSVSETPEKMKRKVYEAELEPLQVELVKLQE